MRVKRDEAPYSNVNRDNRATAGGTETRIVKVVLSKAVACNLFLKSANVRYLSQDYRDVLYP